MAKQAKKDKSLSWYKKELDRVFSQFIRLRDKGVCFTCGNKKYWKLQQNGHYISRVHMSVRFSEKNCNAQCASCNIFKNGNMDEYALALQKKWGKGILLQLNQEKYKVTKLTREWYEQKIEHYKKQVKKFTGE